MLGKFFKAGSGAFFAQAISLISLPFITRIYPPDSFADYFLFIASTYIFGGITCLTYEISIVTEEKDSDATNIFFLCIILCFLVSIIFYFFISITINQGFLGNLNLNKNIFSFLTSCGVFFPGIAYTFQYWATRNANYFLISKCIIIVSLVTPFSQFILGSLTKFSSAGLILGPLIAHLFSSAYWIIKMKKYRNLPSLRLFNLKQIIYLLKKNQKFPKYSMPFVFFGSLRARASIYIISFFMTPEVVSFYSLAHKVVYSPVSLSSAAMRPVVFKEIAKNGIEKMEKNIFFILRIITFSIIPFLFIYANFYSEIYTLIFGKSWENAGKYGIYLILPAYTFMLCAWMDRILDYLGKQKISMLLEVIFGSSSLLVLYFFLVKGYSLEQALISQAIILTSYNVSYLFITFKLAGFNLKKLYVLFLYAGIIIILINFFIKIFS